MERFVFADEHNCDRTYVLYADAQAAVEALQRERDEANLYRDQARANQESLAACVDRDVRKIKDLQAALDAEREKVANLDAMYRQQLGDRDKRIEALAWSAKIWMERYTQLQALVRAKEAAYEKILLSRERLEREVRGYPPVDNEGIPMVWEEPVGWVKRTLDATTPAPDTSIIGKCAPPAQWNQNAQVRGDVG